MTVILMFVLACSLWACQEQHSYVERKADCAVVCFEHYAPKRYRTPGGRGHAPLPKVLYTDSMRRLVSYVPDVKWDTLVLPARRPFCELALSYADFEFVYYPLLPGDTVNISLDSLGYPLLRSKHHPAHNRFYDLNRLLRKGRTHGGLEAKTCLGSDWVRIAQTIDVIRANQWSSLLMDYCPIDSLQALFRNYKAAYADSLNSLKQGRIISDSLYEHYQWLMELKEYESRRMLNQDTAFYRRMERGLRDERLLYPSYHEYLEHYLWFLNQHVPTVQRSQGGCKDWRQTFDELTASALQPQSKRLLLERCLREIGENFSASDIAHYAGQYVQLTSDTLFYSRIREQYQLSTDADQLLLHNVRGETLSLDQLLSRQRGKVLYMMFWASWCAPCHEELPHLAQLRDAYKDREVAFACLAYQDTQEDWEKELKKEGMNLWENQWRILNFKNSHFLEQIRLESIPRFLIFDREGRLVEVNAPRPSSGKCEVYIEKYLQP